MQYIRVNDIGDPLFRQIHDLLKKVFPPEEVLAFELWEEPLRDPGIRVFAAVLDGEVVGVTEYRYYSDWEVAMTDFTIIGREGLGIGPFLVKQREADLLALAGKEGKRLKGMFAEIYNPMLVGELSFGGVWPMNPFVRREVLSHLGYRRLDFPYVHPSWENDGEAVGELDLSYLAYEDGVEEVPASLVADFLTRYYAVLDQKPQAWLEMVEGLRARGNTGIPLLPL
ncbi:GNAT family N-acetyltransferase [Paenibacillus turpanensis]|uniref:GNAT family N-acetyltransferase n=1 Tax=Paenibacillus turpanensis TaxID=2689078 RepID=UPI00140A0087|nr:GNAT family N-acetyltransferase [Paenibacillus turpanensis]